MPGGALCAALGQGLGLPGLRPRPLRRAQGPGGLPVQPLQAPGRPDRRHRVPLDQAAADHLVSGDLPPDPEQGRDELGRAGAPARHAAADRLADQAQADGGDGRRARPASPSSQAGSRSTTPISAASARAASAAGVRPARRRSWPRSRRRPSASPGGCGSRWSRASARRRSRRWPSATSPPAATWSAMACPAGRRSRRPAARTSRWSPARAAGRQVGALHLGQHRAGQHQDRARRHLPSRQRQARPALPRQLRLALQPPLPARHPDRAARSSRLCQDAPHPYRVIIAG